MRRYVGIVVLAWLFIAAVAASAAAASFRCPPHRSQLLKHDHEAFVYIPADLSEHGEIEGDYSCAIGARRGYAIGLRISASPGGNEGGFDHLMLSGQMLADETIAAETARDDIVVRNLLTGRWVHKLPVGGKRQLGGNGSVGSMVLKQDGAVAWIVRIEGANPVLEVWAADTKGLRVLASGATITPGSLRLRGSILSWVNGGVAARATLR
jgi:hypothetical protein